MVRAPAALRAATAATPGGAQLVEPEGPAALAVAAKRAAARTESGVSLLRVPFRRRLHLVVLAVAVGLVERQWVAPSPAAGGSSPPETRSLPTTPKVAGAAPGPPPPPVAPVVMAHRVVVVATAIRRRLAPQVEMPRMAPLVPPAAGAGRVEQLRVAPSPIWSARRR